MRLRTLLTLHERASEAGAAHGGTDVETLHLAGAFLESLECDAAEPRAVQTRDEQRGVAVWEGRELILEASSAGASEISGAPAAPPDPRGWAPSRRRPRSARPG